MTGTTDLEKASLFNSYFHSVFTRSTYNIPPLNQLPTPTTVLSEVGLSELDVFEALLSLEVSKSAGIDGISPRILKKCAPALYKPIHHLFMLSLSQHYLPLEWRQHLITPIFKSGNKSSVCNYRPISLLCVISKVFEKIIYIKMVPFVSNFISSSQFGFRPKHSTTQQLLVLLSAMQDSFCSTSQADIIYLDFKKAFDSVPHNELLVKLWSLGITGTLWKWLRAYIHDRYQCVRVGQSTSKLLPVLSGVPQGSILGPLLFLIYVNDLPSVARHSRLFLYADDAKCLKNVFSLSDCHCLQEDLLLLSSWSQKWNLDFNENKCAVLRLCPKRPCFQLDYTLQNTPIRCVESIHDLGVVFSSDLLWNDHIKFISSRAYRVLGLIRRSFSSNLDSTTKRSLYIALVRTQITYCSQVWRPHLLKDIISLERIQRRATKYITGDFTSNYKTRLLSLRILPLMMYLELLDIMFFIKCLKNPDSNAFSVHSYVTFSTNPTRAGAHLKLTHTFTKSNITGHFYFNRLPRLWNSLPPINLNQSTPSILL